jgi:hypothetical protein
MGGFMEFSAEMASDAMLRIPSFIKSGPGIQNLTGVDSQTHRQHGHLISLILFVQNKESRLKTSRSSHRGRKTQTQQRPASRRIKTTLFNINKPQTNKKQLRGLSPQANYTD